MVVAERKEGLAWGLFSGYLFDTQAPISLAASFFGG